MAVRTLWMIIMVMVVFHFGLAGEPVRSVAATASGYSSSATAPTSSHISNLIPNCTCGNVTVVCSKPTSPADHWVPWISSVCSILLFSVPAIRRIWKLSPQHLGVRNTFFCWSLILGLAQCIFWAFYFSTCESGYSTCPMWLSSFAGIWIHVLLVLVATSKVPTHVSGCRTRNMIYGGLCLSAFASILRSNVAATGWVGLGFGFISQCFKMTSMDYSEFNLELCLYSVFGTATAFIWLYHPNICVALQYKSTSYILGFLRGVEVYQWIVPKFAAWLRKVEGAEEATGPERYDE